MYVSILQGGIHVVQLLDSYVAPIALIFVVFLEALSVSWLYGNVYSYLTFTCTKNQLMNVHVIVSFLNIKKKQRLRNFSTEINWCGIFFVGVERFSDDIKSMLGFRPGIFWRICWKFLSPAILLVCKSLR